MKEKAYVDGGEGSHRGVAHERPGPTDVASLSSGVVAVLQVHQMGSVYGGAP